MGWIDYNICTFASSWTERDLMMETMERIQYFERLLDGVGPVLKDLEAALDRFDGVQGAVQELSAYYGSEDWHADLAEDEAGRLPAGLKRGVLSEDGIYDVLSDHYTLTVRLLDTVSAILKNR